MTRDLMPRVLRQGKVCTSAVGTLRFLSLPQGPSLFSVVVSKRVAKSAVVRNKLKRWGREVAHTNFQHAGSSYAAVFTFRPQKAPLRFTEFKESLSFMLRQMR